MLRHVLASFAAMQLELFFELDKRPPVPPCFFTARHSPMKPDIFLDVPLLPAADSSLAMTKLKLFFVASRALLEPRISILTVPSNSAPV